MMCAIWSLRAGAAAGCRCKVLLQAAVRAGAGYKQVHLRNLGATGYCCQSGVRYEAWVLALHGVAARCPWQWGRWALMGVYAVAKKASAWWPHVATENIFCYLSLGPMLAQFSFQKRTLSGPPFFHVSGNAVFLLHHVRSFMFIYL